jgi:hypothetical protein
MDTIDPALIVRSEIETLDVAFLIRRRSQSPTALPKMVVACGAPTIIKSALRAK